MNISARNVLPGTVTAITKGSVNTEVELAIAGNNKVVAVITNASVVNLGLAVGGEAFAVIKAPLVIIAKGKQELKFSTRNMLAGTVGTVTPGSVNAEVSLDLAGGVTISAIITVASVREMALQAGDQACALFKASNVILAVRA